MTTLLQVAIRKQLKAFALEVELNLDSSQGQVLVLFGPSGSGKTMTLKAIAGSVEPDAGFISIGERTVFDSKTRLKVKQAERKVGYLPQNYALFPHLNVTQNVAFGLFKWDKRQAALRVKELLELMQLGGLEKRYPRELSGGQQQRVALARALAPQPTILLLDEPFAALDSNIRAELRENLALLSRQLQVPVVFITHDLEEAYMLADRIAVYEQGHVLQLSSRDEVFYRPANVQVARLLGIRNLWEGRVLELQAAQQLALVRTAIADVWVALPPDQSLPAPGSKVTLCIRPERLKLLSSPAQASNKPVNFLNGQLVNEIARGSRYTLFFSVGQTLQSANYDVEIEITTQQYEDLRQQRARTTDFNSWQIELDPANVHLI